MNAPDGASGNTTGGATIADRFKLENIEAKDQRTIGRKSALWALIAGSLALVIVGALTFTLWKHWEFLMPA